MRKFKIGDRVIASREFDLCPGFTGIVNYFLAGWDGIFVGSSITGFGEDFTPNELILIARKAMISK